MKRLIVLFIATFLLMPTFAMAHTQLSTSNPRDGQVITDDIKDLTLTFEGTIEKLSTMGLLRDGQEVPLIQVQIQGAKMVGSVKEPLGNGTYQLQWKIAGHDGHPVTGEIQFQVKTDQVSQDPNPPISTQDQGISGEETQNQPITNQSQVASGAEEQSSSTTTDQQINKDQSEKITKADSKTQSSNNLIIGIFIGLLVLLVIGFFLLLRKK
ncbi:copper resistance protein CopC [Bacillus sp. sid0103]|uniref:copper resistance protein CopC n=1 Tax=Bacillus sp. sid0103 TaxID=2856337 RepID=UPI001C467D50|nr:copper resistance protein CopC [Bacillus sp. sid0103]MBV7504592.1 copper resistance protein CopC [Bacillus sp. sid0103]